MTLTKKHIDIVTKICDSRKEGKRTSYLAKTTFFDGRRYYTKYAIDYSRQEAGEKSLTKAIEDSGLSIDDVDGNISFCA